MSNLIASLIKDKHSNLYKRSYLRFFFRFLMFLIFAKTSLDLVAKNGVFSGDLFPRSLYLNPADFMYLEWPIYLSILGLSLYLFIKPTASKIYHLLTGFYFIGTLLIYSNQKFFMFFILALSLFIDKKLLGSNEKEVVEVPFMGPIKNLLLTMFFFAFCNKIAGSFYSGASLEALFYNLSISPYKSILSTFVYEAKANYVILSWGILLFQGLIPLGLNLLPRFSFLVLAIVHLSMALIMPGIWVFTGAVILAGSLFVCCETKTEN